MINTAEDAKNAIITKVGSSYSSDHLQVDRLESEPDYWLVSVVSGTGESLVGGVAYVVNNEGMVFETSASLPPAARIQAAKAN